jgi:hypothetical protein
MVNDVKDALISVVQRYFVEQTAADMEVDVGALVLRNQGVGRLPDPIM